MLDTSTEGIEKPSKVAHAAPPNGADTDKYAFGHSAFHQRVRHSIISDQFCFMIRFPCLTNKVLRERKLFSVSVYKLSLIVCPSLIVHPRWTFRKVCAILVET